MESFLVYGAAVLLVALILMPYLFKFSGVQKEQIARRKEAEELDIIRPTSQYPLIDDSLCIGCGACVSACPEYDVLGVVYGKAMIINGLRCVGHGHCEPACPVSAIKVGLGDITKRDDIPILDAAYQSVVPGLYVVGELGGLSLIKNAVEQGKGAIKAIAADQSWDREDRQHVDVLIVGAGPAGLSAALCAKENGLSYLLIDQQDAGGTILQYPRKKLVMTQPVEIPMHGTLTRREYEKEDLLKIWYDIIEKEGLGIETQQRVQALTKTEGVFHTQSSDKTHTSKNVVLALGRRGTPRKLGVPGEHLAKVAYQLIDAQSYQGKHLLVVGGGDSAVEAAIGLSQQRGNTVTVSYRKAKFFRIKKKNEERISTRIKEKKIIPLFDSNVLEIGESTVKIDCNGETLEIPNDYIFIFAGGIPPFKMLKEMGIRFGGDVREMREVPAQV